MAKLSPVIAACLSEAMGYAESGVRPARLKPEVQLPDELLKAFESDPELAAAFYGLTPGRQKSYVINLNSAKRPETKVSRIARNAEHGCVRHSLCWSANRESSSDARVGFCSSPSAFRGRISAGRRSAQRADITSQTSRGLACAPEALPLLVGSHRVLT